MDSSRGLRRSARIANKEPVLYTEDDDSSDFEYSYEPVSEFKAEYGNGGDHHYTCSYHIMDVLFVLVVYMLAVYIIFGADIQLVLTGW
jgi:hypothetical protein